MADLLKNFAYCTLTAAVGGATTTIPVNDTSRLPTNAELSADNFWMTFESTLAAGEFEIVRIVSKSTTSGAGNLTVVRAQQGTTGYSHASGTVLKHALTASMVSALANTVTSVAGRTGAVTLTAADVGPGTFAAGTYNFPGTLQEAGNRVYSAGNPPPAPATMVTTDTVQSISGYKTFSAAAFNHDALDVPFAGAGNSGGIRIVRASIPNHYAQGTAAGDFALRVIAPKFHIKTVNDTVPLSVQGGTGGTADLQRWETSAGAVVAKVTAAGLIYEGANRVYSAGNSPPYPVASVAGRTGAVTLTAADIGAGTFPAGTFIFPGSVTLGSGGAGAYGDANGNVFLETGAASKVVYVRPNGSGSNIGMTTHFVGGMTVFDSSGTERGLFSVDSGAVYLGTTATNLSFYQLAANGSLMVRGPAQTVAIGDANIAGQLGAEVKLSGSGNHHWSMLNNLGVLRFGTADGGGGLGLARENIFEVHAGSATKPNLRGLYAPSMEGKTNQINTQVSTTSTSYVSLSTPEVEVICVAGPSGKAFAAVQVTQSNSGSSATWTAVEVYDNTGGGLHLAAADDWAVRTSASGFTGASAVVLVQGLTPGNEYLFRLRYKVAAGTGQYLNRRLTVWNSL